MCPLYLTLNSLTRCGRITRLSPSCRSTNSSPKSKLHIDDVDIIAPTPNLTIPARYTLCISGDASYVKGLSATVSKKMPVTNRTPDHMTKLFIMTGVTAISRTSAFKIDAANDPALPARAK